MDELQSENYRRGRVQDRDRPVREWDRGKDWQREYSYTGDSQDRSPEQWGNKRSRSNEGRRWDGYEHDDRYRRPREDDPSEFSGRVRDKDRSENRSRRQDRDGRRDDSRTRSRSRSRERYRDRDSDRRRRNYNDPEPSPIIMLRNLKSNVSEEDLTSALGSSMSAVREVRLIRDRNGTPKGFAFMEFYQLEDAVRWIESNKNSFTLKGGPVHLEYSRQRSDRDRHGRDEWMCFKCSTRNYRNVLCTMCECSRSESESLGDDRGRDPAQLLERESNPPSQILILKGLDSQTSEESVHQAIQVVTNLPVQDIRVIKDKMTGLGRGFCFVDLSTIEMATEMLKILRSQSPAFFVDGKRVYANFARGHSHSDRQSQSSLASTAIAAAAALQQNEQYYKSGQPSQMTSKKTENKSEESTSGQEATGPTVTLANGAKVQLPATYTLDPTSGYYYDSATGLYYDPQSGYYYNSSTGQYCYYDAANNKYVPISNTQSAETQEETKKKKKKEESTVTSTSSAKKIMKDMERWAKKQEKQQKLVTHNPEGGEQGENPSEVEETDVVRPGMGLSFGFSHSIKTPSQLMEDLTEEKPSLTTAAMDIESEPVPPVEGQSSSHIDWNNLTCLLCKRKFNSREQLTKHKEFSSLHKQNLQKHQQPQSSATQEVKYRDRAKERRDRYGAIDPIIPGWKKHYDQEKSKKGAEESYVPTIIPEEATPVEQGKGSQLLQAMGWSEGQGLGRNNQGITAPIKADGRQGTTGLGGKSLQYDLTGAHTYLSAVKRMTVARFKEIGEN